MHKSANESHSTRVTVNETHSIRASSRVQSCEDQKLTPDTRKFPRSEEDFFTVLPSEAAEALPREGGGSDNVTGITITERHLLSIFKHFIFSVEKLMIIEMAEKLRQKHHLKRLFHTVKLRKMRKVH